MGLVKYPMKTYNKKYLNILNLLDTKVLQSNCFIKYGKFN